MESGMEHFIAGRLKELCEERNISVYRLAREADVSTSSLYSILREETSPRVSTLEILCRTLGVSLEEFFCGYRDGESEMETEEIVGEAEDSEVREGNGLSDENRKLLEAFERFLVGYQG